METKEILDTSVAFGKVKGVITIFTAIEYTPTLKKSFEIIFPDGADYVKAIEIANKLREKGKPVGAIDILIAGMCINRESTLLTKDMDFKIIQEFFPMFRTKLI